MSPHEVYDPETGKLEERRSYVPAIASISSALMFGAVAFWGVATSSGVLAPGPPSLPDEAAGPPNAPIINAVTAAGDSVTFRLDMSDFAGSQDDTHDSTRILVDSAGKDFTSPLVDSTTGPVTTDTISHGFANTGVYDFRALYKGASGGWSDTSEVSQKTVSFSVAQITTLSVVSASDSSLTLQWVTVHDGTGEKAHHQSRYKNTTGDTASFSWGGTQESNSADFDSLGTNIADTVTKEITGLVSGDRYEFGVIAYRDDEGDGDPFTGEGFTYGPVPTSETRAAGTVQAGGGGDPVAPSTPSVTLSSTSDTSNIQMTGSGFDGENQTHDSTEWRLDDDSGMGNPFYTTTTAADLTSHLATDNANLDADATYYGDVRYFASSTGWTARSAVDSVVNTAPSANYPKEPAGFGELRTWDGSTLVPTGFNEYDTGPAKHSRVVEGGLPSGNAALYRKTFPSGLIGGKGTEFLSTDAGGFFPNGGPATNSERLYIHFWIRPDANWDGHSSGTNKVLYFGGDTFSHMFFRMSGAGSGTLTATVVAQDLPTCSNSTKVFDSGVAIPRGSWTRIELLMAFNTTGNNDGTIEMWVDGVLALDEGDGTSCHFQFGDNRERFIGAETNSIWGGAGDELTASQDLDLDDIRISGGSR